MSCVMYSFPLPAFVCFPALILQTPVFHLITPAYLSLCFPPSLFAGLRDFIFCVPVLRSSCVPCDLDLLPRGFMVRSFFFSRFSSLPLLRYLFFCCLPFSVTCILVRGLTFALSSLLNPAVQPASVSAFVSFFDNHDNRWMLGRC